MEANGKEAPTPRPPPAGGWSHWAASALCGTAAGGFLLIALLLTGTFFGFLAGYVAMAGLLEMVPFGLILAGRDRPPRLQALALTASSAPLACLGWFVSLEWDLTAVELGLAYGWCAVVALAGLVCAIKPNWSWPLLAVTLASLPATGVLAIVTSQHPFVIAASLVVAACGLHAWRVRRRLGTMDAEGGHPWQTRT